jgi:5-methylcytosine-specific restriction endonuclease McrA
MQQNHSNKITDEHLITQFQETPHLGKIACKLNLPPITIWRRLNKLDLKCSSNTNQPTSIPLEEILDGQHPHYQTFKLKKRLLKEGILQNMCSNCNIDSWNNQPIALHLDHIDGVASNHRLDNLRLLCPNCHSQTNTYCGKNKKIK